MGDKKHKNFKWRRLSAPLFIAVLIIGVYGMTAFFQPQRLAGASDCVIADGSGGFTNTCGAGINLTVCSAPTISNTHCVFIPLATDAAAETGMYKAALPNFHFHACRAPYMPAMVPTIMNGKELEAGCMPVD